MTTYHAAGEKLDDMYNRFNPIPGVMDRRTERRTEFPFQYREAVMLTRDKVTGSFFIVDVHVRNANRHRAECRQALMYGQASMNG